MVDRDHSVIGWRAWYDGGRTFTSKTTEWVNLPDDGMQAMVIYFATGNRTMESGNDFYFQVPGTPLTVIYGSESRSKSKADIRKRYPGAIVKLGRWTNFDELNRVQDEASVKADAP